MTLFRHLFTIVIVTALTLTTGGRPVLAAAPDTLRLPDGFQPEGIAIGTEPYAYLGSRGNGDILKVNLRTGKNALLSAGTGTPSLGLKLDDRGRLFVAGGTGGDARVIDTATGRVLKTYRLRTGTAFINDVVLTKTAAWFTDSANPVLFKLPLGADGELPDAAIAVPLTGSFRDQAGTNANGIVAAPDGRHLLVVQSNTGKLFRVSLNGRSSAVDLGGESLLYGDGMLLRGNLLYVVQNRDNSITKIKMNKDADRGAVQSRTKDIRFDVPTTIAQWGTRFYLPNARLTTTATPTTTYDAVSLAIP
ncbi:superoxide dismutase [Actinoplanes sp. NPDC051411]|uniref:SMP-30/gluconolactonase/LRE family protein n=1 Tax=Actinoplanes sp. NPDC051411 TaxID=3155522 RepID=UPI0034247D18